MSLFFVLFRSIILFGSKYRSKVSIVAEMILPFLSRILPLLLSLIIILFETLSSFILLDRLKTDYETISDIN